MFVERKENSVRMVETPLLQLMPILLSIFFLEKKSSGDLGLTFTIGLTKGRRGQTAVSRLQVVLS